MDGAAGAPALYPAHLFPPHTAPPFSSYAHRIAMGCTASIHWVLYQQALVPFSRGRREGRRRHFLCQRTLTSRVFYHLLASSGVLAPLSLTFLLPAGEPRLPSACLLPARCCCLRLFHSTSPTMLPLPLSRLDGRTLRLPAPPACMYVTQHRLACCWRGRRNFFSFAITLLWTDGSYPFPTAHFSPCTHPLPPPHPFCANFCLYILPTTFMLLLPTLHGVTKLDCLLLHMSTGGQPLPPHTPAPCTPACYLSLPPSSATHISWAGVDMYALHGLRASLFTSSTPCLPTLSVPALHTQQLCAPPWRVVILLCHAGGHVLTLLYSAHS